VVLEPEGTSRKRGITPDVSGRTPLIVLAACQSMNESLGDSGISERRLQSIQHLPECQMEKPVIRPRGKSVGLIPNNVFVKGFGEVKRSRGLKNADGAW
jgi:hypothetical protein